jgi:6-phosphogluconate dehydrogenase (decarboxylating)
MRIAGAGSCVKKVHDDIEYGLIQAHGEGFDVLNNKSRNGRAEDERCTRHIGDVAEVWRRGIVDDGRGGSGGGESAGSGVVHPAPLVS